MKGISLSDLTDELRARDPETFDVASAEAEMALRLGDEIQRLREAAGLTQAELAFRMGTRQPTIARLERGGTTPTVTTLMKIARALGVHLTVSLGPAAAPASKETKKSKKSAPRAAAPPAHAVVFNGRQPNKSRATNSKTTARRAGSATGG